mmetsp:Transcript_6798/g.17633  ORF Transcript_6798/g.17633 Transcript_6798/m.17633 type:complete len:148 (-) Transcript_6798:756-1199(-)
MGLCLWGCTLESLHHLPTSTTHNMWHKTPAGLKRAQLAKAQAREPRLYRGNSRASLHALLIDLDYRYDHTSTPSSHELLSQLTQPQLPSVLVAQRVCVLDVGECACPPECDVEQQSHHLRTVAAARVEESAVIQRGVARLESGGTRI